MTSLVAWVPSPDLRLNLEPKVLPARAELVPRCVKPALLPLPAQLGAADPALARLARPDRAGVGPFPGPRGSGRPPRRRSVSETPPPPPRAAKPVIFNHLPACGSAGRAPTLPTGLLGAGRARTASPPAPGARTSRSGARYHCRSKPWRRWSEKSARKLQRPLSSLRSRDALSRGYSIPPCSASPQPQRSGPSTAQVPARPRTMISRTRRQPLGWLPVLREAVRPRGPGRGVGRGLRGLLPAAGLLRHFDLK